MKAIRVTYQVRPDFVATNESNIQAVMAELAALGDSGVRYMAFRTDETTFVHVVILDSADKADVVPGLEAFGTFRAALKGGAVSPPSQADWAVVGTSF